MRGSRDPRKAQEPGAAELSGASSPELYWGGFAGISKNILGEKLGAENQVEKHGFDPGICTGSGCCAACRAGGSLWSGEGGARQRLWVSWGG